MLQWSLAVQESKRWQGGFNVAVFIVIVIEITS